MVVPFSAAFVPVDSACVYRIRLGDGFQYESPMHVFRLPRETVCPFLDQGGNPSMTMYSLSSEHCRYHEALRRGAAFLEAYANGVRNVIFSFPGTSEGHMCALTMIGWHLIDDNASIKHLHTNFNFAEIDVAVWATLATVRNMWALKPYISGRALNDYLECFNHLVSLLKQHGVTVHTPHCSIG